MFILTNKFQESGILPKRKSLMYVFFFRNSITIFPYMQIIFRENSFFTSKKTVF